MESIKLEDLGVTFINMDGLVSKDSAAINDDLNDLCFGPCKKLTKSYAQWDGCDGKLLFPYNKKDKLGKISDFVTKAIMDGREEEKKLM